jgi:hypothetical protein
MERFVMKTGRVPYSFSPRARFWLQGCYARRALFTLRYWKRSASPKIVVT